MSVRASGPEPGSSRAEVQPAVTAETRNATTPVSGMTGRRPGELFCCYRSCLKTGGRDWVLGARVRTITIRPSPIAGNSHSEILSQSRAPSTQPLHLRYGIKPMTAQRMAAHEPPQGQAESSPQTPLLNGLISVSRARRVVAACRRKHRRDTNLVSTNERQRGGPHRSSDSPVLAGGG